ncbi:MAG: GlxA family transcriptional regulator [Parvularculaceae bacterium]
MFGNPTQREPQRVEFLLLPNFSMMAFTSSVEPLRAANRMSGKALYEWRTVSANGEAVTASNGVKTTPDGSIQDPINADVLFVCAGLQAQDFNDRKTISRLRDYARARAALGSVCTGSIALAKAGLLDGYRCTIHWENVEGFVEAFPDLDVTATLFEIDRDRFTCSGGTAPLDMMIYSISEDYGRTLAINVAEQMLHNFVRQPHDHQRMSIQHRTGITHPKLLAAIAYMEAYIETPVPVGDIARSVNVSPRQLERLFRNALNKTPTRYYLELRLQKAKLLLAQTTMPVLQIAVATGFTSAAHFASAFRNYFGHPPSAERNFSGGQAATA